MTERQVPSRLLCCSPGFQNCCTTHCPLLPCAPNHPLNYTPKKKKYNMQRMRPLNFGKTTQGRCTDSQKFFFLIRWDFTSKNAKKWNHFHSFVSSALAANVRPRLSTCIQKEKAALHRFKILS